MWVLCVRKLDSRVELAVGLRFFAQSSQGEAEIVVGRLVVGRALDGPREMPSRRGKVFAAVGEDAQAGKGSSMMRVARQGLLEERFGELGLASVEGNLSKLVVGLGLDRLQIERSLELRLSVRDALLHLEEVAEAEVSGRIIRVSEQVRAQMPLCIGEVLPVELDAREGIESGRIIRLELEGSLKRILRDRELMDLLCLDTEIQKERPVVGQVFPGVLQADKGRVRSTCLASFESELRGGGQLTLPGVRIAQIQIEDGFKTFHGFREMMLGEENLSEQIVRSGCIRTSVKDLVKQSDSLLRPTLVEANLREQDEGCRIIWLIV